MGRTAEIFPIEEGKVLKLFLPTIPLDWIDQEVDTGRYIQDLQLPVPRVFQRGTWKGREGVVYERIEGPSLLNALARRPWKVVQYARLLAGLHARVHDVPAPAALETQREWAAGALRVTNKLSDDVRERVLHLLDCLPAGNQLCHGDFHPGNIILTRRGPMIIDWMTASKGVACGDVARTSIILEAAQAPAGTPMRWLLQWVRKLFLATYLQAYFQLRPLEKKSLTAWRVVMAADFLADAGLPEEEAALRDIVEQGLRSVARDG